MSEQRTTMCCGDSLTWGWIPVKEECQFTFVHMRPFRHFVSSSYRDGAPRHACYVALEQSAVCRLPAADGD